MGTGILGGHGRRRGRVLTAAVACACALGVTAPTAATAATGEGSAYSAAAKVSPTGSLAPQVTGTGLLQLLGPVLSGVVNPLTNALGALPGQLLAGVADGLTGAGLRATNPAARQPAPQSGYPASCSTGGWTASDCYGPILPSIGLPPLLALSTGVVQGFATGDTTGYTARAHVANPDLSVLGIQLGNLGVIDAQSHCGPDSCTTAAQLTGASLLGGLVTANLADDSDLLAVSVGGTPLVTGSSVVVPAGSLPAGLHGVTATLDGNLLELTIGLSLTGLLDGLGLGDLLAGVAGLADGGSSIALTLTVGPGSQPADGSTEAWGLAVGVDLAASISLSLLGLAGVTVTISSGISGSSYGNLLDLELAYTNAFSGDLPGLTPQWIPPGLI
jgi:hypothetical protein